MPGNLTFQLEILFVLISAVFGGVVAKKLRLPLVVGYLVAGVVLGTAFKARFGEGVLTPTLAELGVALLLFSIGLEFPLQKFAKVGRLGILGAVAQILGTIVVSLVIFPFIFNFSFANALFFGSLISLSSTAVVIKSLSDRGVADSPYGELMITWLLIQDLAVIPLMALFSAEASGGGVVMAVVTALVKTAVLLIGAFVIGRKLIPGLFDKLAFLGSRELLTIGSLTVCVLLAALSAWFGLSFAIGAFLAGLILSSADLSHEINGVIRPLKDLFAAVFFVSLGFLVNLGSFTHQLPLIIGLLIATVVIKSLICYGLATFLEYHRHVAINVALGLSNIGEFAFILAAAGLTSGLIGPEFYQTILGVVALSLVLMPIGFANSHQIYRLFKVDDSSSPGHRYKDLGLMGHTILVGFGRVGRHVAEALVHKNISIVIIDFNRHALREARRQGYTCIYGDPVDEGVLTAAGVSSAKSLILAVPEVIAEELVIKEARRLNANIKIHCRAHTDADAKFLSNFHITTVVEPEVEAAKALVDMIA